jgi:beta-glucosidase
VDQSSKYLDVPAAPLFPFGHGMSYTHFAYSALRVSPQDWTGDGQLSVEAAIENQGPVAGEETCFLFIHDSAASIARPVLELRGFAKIALDPGQRGTVRFELKASDLGFPDEDGSPRLEAGEFEILVGPCADNNRLIRHTISVLST